jgi:predicted Fe-S protein YdhL (DUF1289 family)
MSIHDFDPLTHQGSLPSPCINICQMDRKTGLCEGCLRTIDEITRWSSASESDKRAVWLEIKQREQALFPDAQSSDTPAPPLPSAAPRST